ncbi:L10-interacting MYB domain-containing protein-like [Rhododendron vialii]|uniref:L10-interacting MYB domain-containing protein-like n=1 Tax=Rhododendron vialii TaxID=182163 RepID=UPI00265E0CB4|nr:L10-interacting MYB domain-containing protein-like [Rhododendron vialii]
MSSTQTMSSRGKKVATAATKAQLDAQSKECFIQACVEELGGAGYKEETQLTKVGWANVLKKFNERRGKNYDRSQLKNQWVVLKKEWQLWQHLVLGESGLGRDPDTGAITASEEWWDLKLMHHPECIKFKEKPLPLEGEMRILFGSNTATGEHMHTPSSGSILAGPKEHTINLEVDNIDALLDDDAEV